MRNMKHRILVLPQSAIFVDSNLSTTSDRQIWEKNLETIPLWKLMIERCDDFSKGVVYFSCGAFLSCGIKIKIEDPNFFLL